MPRNVVRKDVQIGRIVVKDVIVNVRIVGIAAVEVSVHVEVNLHSHLRALPRAVTRATVATILTSTAMSILISSHISIRSQQLYRRGKHYSKGGYTRGYHRIPIDL